MNKVINKQRRERHFLGTKKPF